MVVKRKTRKPEKQGVDLTHQLLHALELNHDFVETIVKDLCEHGVDILADFSEMGIVMYDCAHDPDVDHEAANLLRERMEPFLHGQDSTTIAVALYPIIQKIISLESKVTEEPELKGPVN